MGDYEKGKGGGRGQALRDPFEVKREGRVEVNIWPSITVVFIESVSLLCIHLFPTPHHTFLIYELYGLPA